MESSQPGLSEDQIASLKRELADIENKVKSGQDAGDKDREIMYEDMATSIEIRFATLRKQTSRLFTSMVLQQTPGRSTVSYQHARGTSGHLRSIHRNYRFRLQDFRKSVWMQNFAVATSAEDKLMFAARGNVTANEQEYAKYVAGPLRQRAMGFMAIPLAFIS